MIMSSNQQFNVAIIGAGVIGNRLASVFSKIPELKIKFICDLESEKAKTLASKYSSMALSDYHDILNDTSISVVYIGVPPAYHKDLTISFLQAGKHVICEKPLALSVKDCNDMIKTKNSAKLLTTVNLPLRYTIGVTEMKKLLHENYVGEIKKIEMKFRFPKWPRAWQNVGWLTKKYQGGPLREVGTHFFFLLHELFGIVDKVFSLVQYPSPDDAETLANGIIKLQNGLISTFDLITGTNEKEENSFTILGSKGTLSFVDWYKLIGTQNDSEEKVLIDYSESSELQMTKDYVKKLSDPNAEVDLVSFEDAKYAQQILQAVYNSNESWIPLEE